MEYEEHIARKIRLNNEIIIKNGTYVLQQQNNAFSTLDTMSQEASVSDEEAAKIAEIMDKFNSNIQNNVSSLFDMA